MASRSNPMKDLRGYLTPEQIKTILLEAKQSNMDHFVLLSLLFRTGRRVSEIVPLVDNKTRDKITTGLRPIDIDWDKGLAEFTILKKKKRPDALLPLDNYTLNLLYRYARIKRLQRDEPFFNITRQQVFKIVRKYTERVEIFRVGKKKPHPHHFRHSLAVAMVTNINRPQAIKLVQDQLQHSSLEMTANYLKFAQEDHKEALEETFQKIRTKRSQTSPYNAD